MRWLLAVLPPALVVALWCALCTGAGRDVREQGGYVALFLMLGVTSFVPTLSALAWLGVSAVDDAIERDNVAAGFAVAGTLIASAVCYTFAVLLVAEDPTLPAADLSHTLLRWQEAKIQIFAMLVDETLHASALQPIRVQKPKWFRVMWQSALALVGLRRHPLGGFGGTLPHPSSG
jgi:hypothetical protein